MGKLTVVVSLYLVTSMAACTSSPRNIDVATKSLSPSQVKPPVAPKNGDYQGSGRVTRIEMKGGSVELDHEEIPDVVPAMKNEFQVSDKSMLNGLKLGDQVEFTLRYNDGQETIVAISKLK